MEQGLKSTSLHEYLEMALGHEEILTGAVNFSHLRTLLFGILKVISMNNRQFVRSPRSTVADTEAATGKVESAAEEGYLSNFDGPTTDNEETRNERQLSPLSGVYLTSESDSTLNIGEQAKPNYNPADTKRLKRLERRLTTLEKRVSQPESFHSNTDIIMKYHTDTEGEMTDTEQSAPPAPTAAYNNTNTQQPTSPTGAGRPITPAEVLGYGWKGVKYSRRLNVAEEGVDKLFSLMEDLLEQHHTTAEALKNLQTADPQAIEKVREACRKNTESLEVVQGQLDENCDNLGKLTSAIDNLYEKTADNEQSIANQNIQIEEQDKIVTEVREEAEAFKPVMENMEKNLELNSTSIIQCDEAILRLQEDTSELTRSLENFDNDKMNHLTEQVKTLKLELEELCRMNQIEVKSDDTANLCEKMVMLEEKQAKLEEMMIGKLAQPPPAVASLHKQPALDTGILAAIQHQAQENRSRISSLQANLNMLKSVQSRQQLPVASRQDLPASAEPQFTTAMFQALHHQLQALQEEHTKLAGDTATVIEDMKGEFLRKQQHIDNLYDSAQKLQEIKADKDDVVNELDIKARKMLLDNQATMSRFDERYQMLEQALQDALSRLDAYVKHGNSLEDALQKLAEELNSKMDWGAEGKLKNFLEERLKEIKKAAHPPLPPMEAMVDPNAAGFRKPVGGYNCISCDRPIDQSQGFMPPAPQKFPARRTMAPHTAYEIEQIRQRRYFTNTPVYDRYNYRACGGQHTLNNNMYRSQRMVPTLDDRKRFSIVDCVVGKDGHIYRGRISQGKRKSSQGRRHISVNDTKAVQTSFNQMTTGRDGKTTPVHALPPL